VAAVQGSLDDRVREAALIRALGGANSQVRAAQLVEYLGLGMLAGLAAAGIATVIGMVLAAYLFELTLLFNPGIWLAGLTMVPLTVSLFGILGTRRILKSPPGLLLREGA